MRATAAIRVDEQHAQPPGIPPRIVTTIICPFCRGPVAAARKTVNGEPFRRHNKRMPNGQLCLEGRKERDPVGTLWAF